MDNNNDKKMINLKVRYKEVMVPFRLPDDGKQRSVHDVIDAIIRNLNKPAQREDGSIREALDIQPYDRNGMPVVFYLTMETTEEDGTINEKKLQEETPSGEIRYISEYGIKDGTVLILDSKLIPG